MILILCNILCGILEILRHLIVTRNRSIEEKVLESTPLLEAFGKLMSVVL